jgi:hypothetical protein
MNKIMKNWPPPKVPRMRRQCYHGCIPVTCTMPKRFILKCGPDDAERNFERSSMRWVSFGWQEGRKNHVVGMDFVRERVLFLWHAFLCLLIFVLPMKHKLVRIQLRVSEYSMQGCGWPLRYVEWAPHGICWALQWRQSIRCLDCGCSFTRCNDFLWYCINDWLVRRVTAPQFICCSRE